MLKNRTLSLVIPCWNEIEAIPSVSARLKVTGEIFRQLRAQLEIIVVDDASTDGSADLLESYPHIKVIRLRQHQGYGAALKTGFAAAKGDYLAMMDLDSTYHPEDLVRMTNKLLQENLLMVFGNRLKNNFHPWRQFGNLLFTQLFKHFLRLPVTDVCSGLRVFDRTYQETLLSLPQKGFNYSIALTAEILTSGIRWNEIPIAYSAREGDSKLVSWYEGWTHLFVIWQTWRSLKQRNKIQKLRSSSPAEMNPNSVRSSSLR